MLALAGGFVCTLCAVAQEPEQTADPQQLGLERVLQVLERVEAEHQALRQEIEALRAPRTDAPDAEDPALVLHESEGQPQTTGAPPEIERILGELIRLEAEQQALRQEIEGLQVRQGEAPAQDPNALVSVDEEVSAPQAEPAAQYPEMPVVEDDMTLPNGESQPEAEQQAEGEPEMEGEAGDAPEKRSVFMRSALDPVAKLYEQGREAFRSLNFYAAGEAFRGFLSKYPGHEDAGEARYWLGETLYVEGRFQEAIAVFAEVIADEASSRREAARLKTGFAWFELGDFEQAETILVQVRDQNPGSSFARLAQLRLDRLQQLRPQAGDE